MEFQSTRPRGARQNNGQCSTCSLVSIHAPARGATLQQCRMRRAGRFNPRARAGRDIPLKADAIAVKFQSTRPRGARPVLLCYKLFLQVSIHAPARGATYTDMLRPHRFCFNPRARAGRDLIPAATSAKLPFQSTRPRGARQIGGLEQKTLTVSIHAPARGATVRVISTRVHHGFNPRARAGRDFHTMPQKLRP